MNPSEPDPGRTTKVEAPPPSPSLVSIYRYPVKGLSAEPLASVSLSVDETLPLDRAWAIENGGGRFDADAPRHLPKINFLMLLRNERLASLDCKLEAGDKVLVVRRAGKPVARGDLTTRIGRQMIEQFFAAYMRSDMRGAPRIVSAPGISFSDVASKVVHLINLATVREIARVLGRPVDPLRFRANLIVDGLPAWAENGWVGRQIGIGSVARLSVIERTGRCEATNVDPASGARDMDIPALLQRTWGHTQVGVYARVVAAGPIAVGDGVSPVTA